eukprot:gene46580-9720_t
MDLLGWRNHWAALTDGRVKYVLHAADGSEQLFNLSADPVQLPPPPTGEGVAGERADIALTAPRELR